MANSKLFLDGNIGGVKLGTSDVKLYLGTTKLYPIEPAYVTCVYTGLYGGSNPMPIYYKCSGSTAQECAGYGSSEEYGINNFSEMKIDDGDWIPAQDIISPLEYPSETGFTITYKLIDNEIIPAGVFKGISHHFVYDEMDSIIIPSTIKTIGYRAFKDCDCMFNGITILAETPPAAMYDANNEWGAFDNTFDCPIYVPSGSVDAYKNAPFWSDYASRIQAIN